MTLTPEALERLRMLEAAATKGPWTHTTEVFDTMEHLTLAALSAFQNGGRLQLTYLGPLPEKKFAAITGNGPHSEANAKLIAALRNHAPALLSLAESRLEMEGMTPLRDKVAGRISLSEQNRRNCQNRCQKNRLCMTCKVALEDEQLWRDLLAALSGEQA